MTDRWDGLVDLFVQATRLKRLRRQGWVYIGVPEPESVAEHSYQLALMTLLLARGRDDIDLERALTLALLHDLPEAVAGDATPFDTLMTEERAEAIDPAALFGTQPAYSEEADRQKRDAEEAGIRHITARLPEDLSGFIIDAWEEYETGQSAEARLVRQADKLEALLQAFNYREDQPDLMMESFRLGTDARVTDPDLRAFLAAIERRFEKPPDMDDTDTDTT